MLMKIAEIKEYCNLMIDKLEDFEDYELELNFTTYWSVPFKAGQLLIKPNAVAEDFRDNIKSLKRRCYIKSKLDPAEFQDLAALFNAIGYKIEKIKEKKRA